MGYSSSYEAKSHGGRQRRLQRMRSATGTRIYHFSVVFQTRRIGGQAPRLLADVCHHLGVRLTSVCRHALIVFGRLSTKLDTLSDALAAQQVTLEGLGKGLASIVRWIEDHEIVASTS
jgi:hypothetical protein